MDQKKAPREGIETQPQLGRRYQSSREFLERVFSEKKGKNPRFSLRAAAKQAGFAPSYFSDLLKGKKKISVETAHRIIQWLKMDRKLAQYFLLVVQTELVDEGHFKNELVRQKDSLDHESVVRDIQVLLERTEPERVLVYRQVGGVALKILYLLKDKATQEPVKEFFNSMVVPERFGGGVGYFFSNGDGTFRNYFQEFKDIGESIDANLYENENLVVDFNSEGLPTVHDQYIRMIGTSRRVRSRQTFTEESLKIEGIVSDDNNPQFSENIEAVYLRV